jgi:hypothetical protein
MTNPNINGLGYNSKFIPMENTAKSYGKEYEYIILLKAGHG